MPKMNLTEEQISDVWRGCNVQTYAADHRNPTFSSTWSPATRRRARLTSMERAGARDATTAGDLKELRASTTRTNCRAAGCSRERSARRRGVADRARHRATFERDTVTVPYLVVRRFQARSTALTTSTFPARFRGRVFIPSTAMARHPKVEIHDPLQAHIDLLRKYTDADIHNVRLIW